MFEPFVGVGPRRYFDLFSMKLSHGYAAKRKVEGGAIGSWTVGSDAVVRVPMLPTSYIEREKQLSGIIPELINPINDEPNGKD